MITVREAEHIINQHSITLESESVSIDQAGGRILKEPIRADRDFPPFDRVTMDGIALKYEGAEKSGSRFKIAGVQAAGSPPFNLTVHGEAIEVMTGAVLPGGSDTVVPYELITIDQTPEKTATLQTTPEKGQNVHKKGSDRLQGEVIVTAGAILGPPEIGIAATVGMARLQVIKPPAVAIISTGDELVPVDRTPLPHQIRSSNAATLAQALDQWHIKAEQFHIVDDLQGTTGKLEELLQSFQVLVMSGGVSKGKFDYVPQALEQLGVKKHFHRIRQRPGKPFWFGSHPSGILVFAFPGNPVSSFMCFNRYLKPWLNKQMGIPATDFQAMLAEDVNFAPDLTYLAQVKISMDLGVALAHPVEGHGSGDLANLVDADGFMELPQGKDQFLAGSLYTVYPYRNLRF